MNYFDSDQAMLALRAEMRTRELAVTFAELRLAEARKQVQETKGRMLHELTRILSESAE